MEGLVYAGIGTMTTAQGPLGLFSAEGDTCSTLSSCPPRNQATAVAVSVNPQSPSVEKPCLFGLGPNHPVCPEGSHGVKGFQVREGGKHLAGDSPLPDTLRVDTSSARLPLPGRCVHSQKPDICHLKMTAGGRRRATYSISED